MNDLFKVFFDLDESRVESFEGLKLVCDSRREGTDGKVLDIA